MRIMVAQINPTIGDLQGNLKKILDSLDLARKEGTDLVTFGELSLCGYPPKDLLFHEPFLEESQRALDEVVAASKGLMVLVGAVRRRTSRGGKFLRNSVAVIQDGALVGFVDKQLLPTYDVFEEARYFEPSQEDARVWDWKGKQVGVLICEDMWQHGGKVGDTDYLRDPVEQLQRLCPDVVINTSASPFSWGKPALRVEVAKEAAKTLGCPVIFCCQVGGNDQLVFDGYSCAVDATGALRQLAKGFEEDWMIVDVDRLAPECVLMTDPVADVYHALVLGVRDYLHKLGLSRACLGLSGGVDSALVAAIAVDALGAQNVLGVSMPSCYNSQESIEDAAVLAKRLGIELLTIPIEKPLDAFLELLTPFFEAKPRDVTEENMQARIRGLILMALSNKRGHIVLNTGNKSELGMGFCTLYGDMCGGLSVISDLTKRQVYELCHFVNGKQERIPERILTKEPSAELRAGQKDSDTLPPYEVVDAVVEQYVEEYASVPAIARSVGISESLVQELVQKIHRAEYKRRQAAPGLRVSRRAFQVGRRYPIVQRWV